MEWPTTKGQKPTTISDFMPFTTDSRLMHDRRLSAYFAAGACRRHPRRSLVVLQQMLSPHIAGGKHRNKRGRRGCFLHVRTPSGFLAFDQAQPPHDLKTAF